LVWFVQSQMHPPLKPLLALLAAFILATPAPSTAQDEAPRPAPRIEDLPPPVRLGARVETVRRAWPVLPIVVIVRDEASYLEALAHWTVLARYPVLIDNGTAEAREDIARFVRAFQPRQVVRWSAPAGAAWLADPAQRRAAIESTIHRVWSRPLPGEENSPTIDSPEQLIARWTQIGVVPPGIILADPADSAWPAAAALALGRLQPIGWTTTRGTLGGTLSTEEYEELVEQTEHAAQATGLLWRQIGDQIDAITLCLNIPAKVQMDASTILATTDLLGRIRPVPTAAPDDAERPVLRWAWTGQVAGTEAQSAYIAMCSLFLATTSAWLFDGYPDDQPWSFFDATVAADCLRQVGVDVTLDDKPRQDLAQWRRRTSSGIRAGLIAVNTKGMGNEFHLLEGRGRPGDVPHLNIPSAVYLVHSFSASSLGARETVAARWLERGAYAYCGSVHEPFLNGFVPTPIFAARMVSTFPWGAAVRMDENQPWKIATLGDPLLALGPAAQRVGEDVSLPLERAADLEEALRTALAGSRFDQALTALNLLGRDQQAARLAAALLREQPEAVTAGAADAALMPVFRMDDLETFVALYGRLSPGHASSGWRRDALWHMAHPRLSATRSRALVELLAAHLRPDQMGRDAGELAGPLARLTSAAGAEAMLRRARDAAPPGEREEVDKALAEFQKRPRRR
jgi:hypothetical protein